MPNTQEVKVTYINGDSWVQWNPQGGGFYAVCLGCGTLSGSSHEDDARQSVDDHEDLHGQ